MSSMAHSTVSLLDLPDEMLLVIFKKLNSVEILHSLVGVNQRLDQLIKDYVIHASFLDLMVR